MFDRILDRIEHDSALECICRLLFGNTQILAMWAYFCAKIIGVIEYKTAKMFKR